MAAKETAKKATTRVSGSDTAASASKTAGNKVTAEKKTTAKKTTTPRKTSAKKTQEVYVQYWGKEFSTSELVDRVKKVWTGDMKKKVSDLKDLKVYIKPEENKVYYVFNEDVNGCIDL